MAGGYISPAGISAVQERESVPDVTRQRYEEYDGATRALDKGGAFTGTQPVELVWWSSPGTIGRSFFDDYYNRVYVIPSVIDFKAVAVDSTRAFDIWNAWLKPITLTGIVRSQAEGTTLSGPAIGTNYPPLAFRRYEALADADGPADFHANYRLDFDTGEKPVLQLLGERARRLPAMPSWGFGGGAGSSGSGASGYSVSYEFKTEIFTSRSGKEQRRATRRTPRRTLAYSSMVWGDGARGFNRHMRDWLNRVVAVPEEPSFARITIAQGIGDVAFALDRQPAWLRPGTTVFIRYRDNEILTEVLAVGPLAITVGSPLPFAAPALETKIILAAYGRLKPELTSRRETSQVFVTGMEIDVTPASEEVRAIREPDLMLNGRPVLTMRANWRFQPDVTYLQPREAVDFGQGRIQVVTPIEFSSRRADWTFSGETDKMERLIDHFTRMRGRAGEFYYSTWEPDLPIDYPIIAGTRTLSFDTEEIRTTFGGDTVHRAVAIMLTDGSVIYNAFQADIGFGDEKTVMTFVNEWAADIPVERIRMISWLYAYRFATDKMEIDWRTSEVGVTRLSFVSLEDRPVEPSA